MFFDFFSDDHNRETNKSQSKSSVFKLLKIHDNNFRSQNAYIVDIAMHAIT